MEILSQQTRFEKQVNQVDANAKKPDVGIVIRSFNRGGAEVLIREMFENKKFNESVGSCDLIILDSKRIELLKDLKNVNYYLINIFSSSFFGFFREYHKLYKLIRQKKYSVLHVHLTNAGVLLRLLKLLLPHIRLVYSEHNVVDSYRRIPYLLNGLTYNKNDYTIFVSREVETCVNKHKRPGFYNYKKGCVIINGIDIRKFHSPDKNTGVFNKDCLTIGTVVSFRKEKRLDRWVEVAAAIRKKYPAMNVKFIMAGIGPEKKFIEELISQKGLNNFIQMPGLIIDTPAVYNTLDIFLMTSEFEGLPVALLEAMSCACIPVTSNIGGIKDLDFDGFGYKYEYFDADTLATVIAEYYNNRTKIVEERKKAREFIVQKNSLDKQVDGYINIYRQVITN